jgi:hypothetical protein
MKSFAPAVDASAADQKRSYAAGKIDDPQEKLRWIVLMEARAEPQTQKYPGTVGERGTGR